MKHIVYSLTLVALLAGCADQPVNDAVIEDRGIKAANKADASSSAITQGAPVEAVQGKPMADAAGANNAAAATAQKQESKPDSKLETRPLIEPAAEVKPLDGNKTTAGAPGTADSVTASGAVDAAGNPKISLNLKDPNSPLAKRVILFDYDSAAIRDEYRGVLEAHAEYLKQNTGSKAILQGHADERGSREYNIALGQRRAESVYKAMSLLGVPEPQIEAVSMGEEKPVSDGHDEAAWQQNRRSEIHYAGE